MTASFLAVLVTAVPITSQSAIAQAARQFDPETESRLDLLEPFVAEAAERFGIPKAWIRAVIAAESGGRTMLDGLPITSPAGAMGPMQVMPATYSELRQRYGLGPDPYDPEQNILAGTAYLGELYRRFGSAGMFAAYNAGPDRYQAYLNRGQPLPAETLAYLATLRDIAFEGSIAPGFAAGKRLFFPLQGTPSSGSAVPSPPDSGSLFIPLNPFRPGPDAGEKGD